MAITVTAHESGTTFGGILLRVKALTGAALAGDSGGCGVRRHRRTAGVDHHDGTGSLVYGAIKTSSTTSLTAAAGRPCPTTSSTATNTERFGTPSPRP